MTRRDSGFELRFSGDDTLGHAVAACGAALDGLGLAARDRNRLAVLTEELLANLIEHGQAATIMLLARREGGHVVLVVEDSGRAFDPLTADLDAPIPERGGGAGLAIVRAWADALSYAPGPSVNRLELRFTLQG